MKLYSKAVYDIETGARISAEFAEYDGPIAACKGAGSEQKNLANQQAAFYQQMVQNQQQQFAGQTAILKQLQDVWSPILAAGPGQRGFTDDQRQALRTQATEGTAAEYKKATSAFNEDAAARGGGNDPLTQASGADEGARAKIASAAAADQSNKNLNITNADYQAGATNFLNATNAMNQVATQQNPLGWAGAASTAGNDAFSSATQVQAMNNQGSFWNSIAPVLGGAASNFFTGGFSSLVNPTKPK